MAQCAGVTLKGDRCKRSAVDGSLYCNTHRYQEDPEMRSRTRTEGAGGGGDAGEGTADETRNWCDPTTWDRETVLYAALGVALAGALLLTRGRR